jgi:ribosomal protein S10
MTRIILKSYNPKVLNTFVNYLKISSNLNNNFKLIRLPKQTKKLTILRSPHVYKKSKDQYQETFHKILIELTNNNLVNSQLSNILTNVPKSIFLKVLQK